jgi:type II secretory pathway component PulF
MVEAVFIALVALLFVVVGLVVAFRFVSAPLVQPAGSMLVAIVHAFGRLWLVCVIMGAMGCFLGPVGWVFVSVIAAMAYGQHMATQRTALLRLIAVSAQRGIPIEAAVEAFAEERGGWLGRSARRLAALLRVGTPLPQAMRAVPGVLPRDALPTVSVGYRSAALGEVFRQEGFPRGASQLVWNALLPKIGYIVFLLGFAINVLIFLTLKIVPQFEKIFKDFGMPLPAVTRLVFSSFRFIGMNWYLFTPISLALMVLLVYGLLRYAGVIEWELPGTNWLVRRLDAAAVLDALSLATERQRPMVEPLAALADAYPKQSVRRRLERVLADVAAGHDWCQSLHRRGMIGRADLALLQAAARVGNLSWAMREMADSNRRRFLYRSYALVQLAYPPLILLIALAEAYVVLALFLPIVYLIRHEAGL